MANPQNPGTFDSCLTDRIPLQTIAGKSGSTGDFDRWYTDRLAIDVYVEAAAEPGPASTSLPPPSIARRMQHMLVR